MSYLTLSEAAQYVNHKAGLQIEPAALLRAGVHGVMLIAAPFSSLMRNLTTHKNDEVLGLLVIPPMHLMEIETEGQTKIIGATSLDGKTGYSPQVTRTRDQLRVLVSELDRFMPYWVTTQQKAPVTGNAPPAPVVPLVTASDGPAPLPAVPNWKMLIQAEAAELFLRLLASGANPTQHSLVKPMANWCRDNEIKTDGNINPSEGYIRTHVLGGGHWTPPTMNREQARKHVAQVAQTKVAQVAQ